MIGYGRGRGMMAKALDGELQSVVPGLQLQQRLSPEHEPVRLNSLLISRNFLGLLIGFGMVCKLLLNVILQLEAEQEESSAPASVETLPLSPNPTPPTVMVNGIDPPTDLEEQAEAAAAVEDNVEVEDPTPEGNSPNGDASNVATEGQVVLEGGKAVQSRIPEINIVAYVQEEVDEYEKYPGAIEVLTAFAESFDGVELKYSYEVHKPKIESATPTLYKVSVTAGYRTGTFSHE